jgi:hypothetical protein
LKVEAVRSRWLASHVGLGALLGVLILHPATTAIYWWYETPDEPLRRFVAQRLLQAFAPAMLPMTGLFAAIGAGLGLAFGLSYRASDSAGARPTFLERELARPIATLLHAGEGEQMEFKGSARWDAKHGRMNKDLEDAVARTIAGFLNHRGGTLLVGVGDAGQVIGVQDDYRTLKRQDRDGLEQFVVTLVKTRLGGDVCPLVHVEFQGLEGKDVCRILVEPSPRPVYYRDAGVARYFLRTGNGTRELDVREAMDHAAQHWAPPGHRQ